MFAVFAEVLGAAGDTVGCVTAADVPRPANPLNFGAAPDDVTCPLAAEVPVGSFVELVLGLGIGLNRELTEDPAVVVAFLAPGPANKFEAVEAVVVAVVPEFAFLAPSVKNEFVDGAAVDVAGEVESAAPDTPVFNGTSGFCPRAANRDGAELCVFAPVVGELWLDKEKIEGFVDSCVSAVGMFPEVGVVDEPAVSLS